MNVHIHGPPDQLAIDQGSSFVSKEMKENLVASGVTLEEAPIETPGSIGFFKIYHVPVCCAFNKLHKALKKEEATDENCFQMAVYSYNAKIDPREYYQCS